MKIENHYTYRTEWSHEDNCFIAKVLEFPSLSAFGDTRAEAEGELNKVIESVIKWMAEEKELIPEPISNKDYKGNISLRIPPETHRNVAIMATSEGISVNQYITSIIERNLFCDSMPLIIGSFENKLQGYIDLFQKMTLLNMDLYRRMSFITENIIYPKDEQSQSSDRFLTYTRKSDENQLVI